jgi:hypothetical protein
MWIMKPVWDGQVEVFSTQDLAFSFLSYCPSIQPVSCIVDMPVEWEAFFLPLDA